MMVEDKSEAIGEKDTPKQEIVEKRVKTTLIRRRAKQVEEKPPEPQKLEAEAVGEVAGEVKAPLVAEGLPTPPVKEGEVSPGGIGVAGGIQPTVGEISRLAVKEERLKKAPRRKKSREEWIEEDIKKAGGLKHFAEQVMETEVGPLVEETPVAPKKVEPRIVEQTFERKRRPVRREFKKTKITSPKAIKKIIKIATAITVSELSQRMGIKSSDIIKKLMSLGIMATVNNSVDVDTATLIAEEHGYEVQLVAFKEEDVLKGIKVKVPKAPTDVPRPPVVTVMGHVDHGKTSILDIIRESNVAEGEAGGITQHIGAYTVEIPKGSITFLDTPGHEAFTSMRSRGAKVTDVVILVVAADDGVMPQTKEAVDHAKAAGVPIVVAINKIDKPNANVEKVKRELAEIGIVTEEWGGENICVNTSAKTKSGISQLLEMVILQAEMLELKADPSVPAQGVVVESRLDKAKGPMTTILVQKGTLKLGDPIVCGLYWGKVRALIDDKGRQVESAGPSTPVEVLGVAGVPVAGDNFLVVSDERVAKVVSENRQRSFREKNLLKESRITLEDLHAKIAAGEKKELRVILKGDVHGSVEAICEALPKLSTEEVKIEILHSGVGGINESDVMLAAASEAVIIGFNVVAEQRADDLAAQERVEVKFYSIIYEMLDEVKKAVEGMLKPKVVETIIGRAVVKEVFNISKIGVIAGLSVTKGKIQRGAKIRVIRDNVVVHDGKIASLKRFKNDAREVTEGQECGLQLEGYQDIKPDDVCEAYTLEEVARKLE